MHPEKHTIFEFFERQQRYVVPLFQRPYVWTMDKQWEPLWKDISGKANEILQSPNDPDKLNKHFLGALVLNSVRQVGFQVPTKSVIDGQQRITTLQIIIVAIRDFANAHKYDDLLQNIKILAENKISKMQSEEKYKVWPTNADQEVFEKVFSAGSPSKIKEKFPTYQPRYARKPEPRPRLAEAYLYYYGEVQSYIEGTGENLVENTTREDRVDALETAFLKYMEVVTIDLDEKDNPQVIFESLNYRGEPLLPSDLIRNFVFLEATKKKLPLEELYKNYWQEYDQQGSAWKQEERQGRITRPRIDLYVFYYLTYLKGTEIPITHLYKEFQEWWYSDKEREIELELKKMLEFSRIFDGFYHTDKSSRTSLFFSRLRTLDTGTVYPLLLYLFGEKKDDLTQTELEGIASDIESFLVRRAVCGLTTKNYNTLFLSLLNNLRKESVQSREVLQKLMLNSQGDSVRWPNDEEFKSKWLSQTVYTNLSHRANMILAAIDLQLTTAKQEKFHIETKLTLEHVLPQEMPEENYPLPRGDVIQVKEARENLIHTFGNLTLLTKELNSSVKNAKFSIKRPAIAEQSALRLNVYFQKLKDPNLWNEDLILSRGKELFEVARKVWGHPDIK